MHAKQCARPPLTFYRLCAILKGDRQRSHGAAGWLHGGDGAGGGGRGELPLRGAPPIRYNGITLVFPRVAKYVDIDYSD